MAHDASALPVGMAGLRYPITQISLAVHDLERVMAVYHRLFGWGPWNVFEHRLPVHHDTELRGTSVHYALRGAEVYVGDMNFELLEPTEGPNLWSEFMDRRGEGIASIAVMFKEPEEGEAVKAAFREQFGIDVTMRARIGDHIEYYYLGTEERFGCLIESGSGHAIDFVRPAFVFPRPETPPSARPAGVDFGITQVSIVVRDLDAGLAAYHRAFGWGPWSVYDGGALRECRLGDEPATFALRWAQAQVGEMNVELVQPLGGPGPWAEHLASRGEGIVSIGLGLDGEEQLTAARAYLEAQGFSVAASARVGDASWFYLDTTSALKCLIGCGSGHAREVLPPSRVYP